MHVYVPFVKHDHREGRSQLRQHGKGFQLLTELKRPNRRFGLGPISCSGSPKSRRNQNMEFSSVIVVEKGLVCELRTRRSFLLGQIFENVKTPEEEGDSSFNGWWTRRSYRCIVVQLLYVKSCRGSQYLTKNCQIIILLVSDAMRLHTTYGRTVQNANSVVST